MKLRKLSASNRVFLGGSIRQYGMSEQMLIMLDEYHYKPHPLLHSHL